MNLPLLHLPLAEVSREDAMREGMSLLLMVSLLGVLVVTMLILWMGMRGIRRKRRRPEPAQTDLSIDAWTEAGKRIDDTITEFDEEL